MRFFRITVEQFEDDGSKIAQTEIYSQYVSDQFTNENPTWLSRVIAVINCLPFPLLTITEPKEK